MLQLARRIRQERSDEAITLSQFAVLAVLDHHGPLTPRKLADHEQIQPPSMTRTLTALADKGYVLSRRQAKLEPEQRATLAEAARIFAIMNAAQ